MRYIFKGIILLFFIFISFLPVGYPKEEARQPVEVLFFYNPGCHHCLKVKNEVLPPLLKKTNRDVKVKFLDIGKIENYQLLLELEKKFPVIGKGERPKIFIGNVFLAGEKAIREEFLERIEHFSNKAGLILQGKPPSKPAPLLLERFRSFHILAVAAAGLLDGVNPCAFAVIVFFISFLYLMKYKRRELAVIGLTFVAAVFITYFLLGLGILRGLQRLAIFYSLAKGVNLLIGVFALILAFLTFWDFYIYKKTGRTREIRLKLPLSTHNFVHRLINKYFRRDEKSKRKPLIILSCLTFLAGILIAICTAACTGQVYLPTIVFMLNMPDLRIKASFYLFLYNLMYIFPLAIIFLVSLMGFSSEKLARWGKNKFGLMKVLLGLLFLVLGIILIRKGI